MSTHHVGPTKRELVWFSLSSEGGPDEHFSTSKLQQHRRNIHREDVLPDSNRPARVRGETIIQYAGLGYAISQTGDKLMWAAEHNDSETVERLILPKCHGKTLQRSRLAFLAAFLVTIILFAGLYYLDGNDINMDNTDGVFETMLNGVVQQEQGDSSSSSSSSSAFAWLSLAAVLSLVLTLLLCAANMMPWIEEPGTSANFYINGEYTSVLHVAAAFGADEVVEILLSCGADPNVTDLRLRTPLHYAALHRRPGACRLLVSGGATTFVKDDLDMYPYDLARLSGERQGDRGNEVEEIVSMVGGPSIELVDAIKVCLEDDEGPDEILELIELRRKTTKKGMMDVREMEMSRDIDSGMNSDINYDVRVGGGGTSAWVDVRDMTMSMSDFNQNQESDGESDEESEKDEQKEKIKRGTWGTWGMTPLMLICRGTKSSFHFIEWEMIVRDIIVECGSHVNLKHPKTGETCLHYSVRTGNHVISQLLLDLGADPLCPRYKDGRTPLHMSCKRKGNIDVVLKMMDRVSGVSGDDEEEKEKDEEEKEEEKDKEEMEKDEEEASRLDPYDMEGTTPLHDALVTACDPSLVRVLLKRGCDPTLAGKSGTSALGSMHTPMGWLASRGTREHLDMMILMAKHSRVKMNMNIRDPCGLSPLHLAARGGRSNVIQWMLEEYKDTIDVSVRCSKSMKTAKEYALANGHDATLKLFERWEEEQSGERVEKVIGDSVGLRSRRQKS